MSKKKLKNKGKHPGGRPTKYKNIDLLKIEELARKGCTDEELAKVIGVHVATLYEYKKRFPEFDEAIKKVRASLGQGDMKRYKEAEETFRKSSIPVEASYFG